MSTITVNGYLVSLDLINSERNGVLLNLIEAPNFPDGQKEAWEHFKNHYRCYTFHPVAPEWWVEHYGEGYEIPSSDIVSQFVYHAERESVVVEEQKDELRRRREIECFPIVNRGEAWYATLTEEQKEELQAWYQSWLDVTDTMVVPTKPEWLS